ncbi:hypothetical protein [Vreelandella neptunia]|uniref:Uncharacterized protein n=1 Tax=Vreelandella neptunia TaxID=115551 RepID=A0ABS9S472_9GAMM|nr:hypothetical protein [Halomonas neptunia]MCH4810905.1 hypothetical protein [Halomonas neptunia]
MASPTPQALSVSQLNQRAKQTLERDVGEVWVEATGLAPQAQLFFGDYSIALETAGASPIG